MRYICDIALRAGDKVLYGTVQGGLEGGSCRRQEKVIDWIDADNDRVHFTDGTTYNHEENPGMTLDLIGDRRPKVLKLV